MRTVPGTLSSPRLLDVLDLCCTGPVCNLSQWRVKIDMIRIVIYLISLICPIGVKPLSTIVRGLPNIFDESNAIAFFVFFSFFPR